MDSTSDDYFEEIPRVCRFGNWKPRKFSANRDFPKAFNENEKIFIDEYDEDIAGLVESEEDEVDYGYLMDHEVDYMNGVNSVNTEIISSDSDDELINTPGCGINAELLSEEELEEEFTDKYEELEKKFNDKYEELEKKFTVKYEELEKKFTDKYEDLKKEFTDKYKNLEKDSASDEESPRVCCSPRAFIDEYDEDIAGLIESEEDDVDYGYLMDHEVEYMNGGNSVNTEIINLDSDDDFINTGDKVTHNHIKKRKVCGLNTESLSEEELEKEFTDNYEDLEKDSASDEESPRVCCFPRAFIDEYDEDIAGLIESEEDDANYEYLMDSELDSIYGGNSVDIEIISSDSDDELIYTSDKVTHNHIKKRKVSAVRCYPPRCGPGSESLSEEELEKEFTELNNDGLTCKSCRIDDGDTEEENTDTFKQLNSCKRRKVSAVRCYPPGCGPDVADLNDVW